MTTTDRDPMTTDEADAVYDVLVREAGASEDDRGCFVYVQTRDYCTEYRFMGSLGLAAAADVLDIALSSALPEIESGGPVPVE